MNGALSVQEERSGAYVQEERSGAYLTTYLSLQDASLGMLGFIVLQSQFLALFEGTAHPLAFQLGTSRVTGPWLTVVAVVLA